MDKMETGTPGLCACGSGINAIHCCKFDSVEFIPAGDEIQLQALAENAAKALGYGERETAAKLAVEVLEQAPEYPDALKTLIEVRDAQNNRPATAALLRRLIKLQPENYWAINKFALFLLARGNIVEAEKQARAAMRIAPENPQSHNLMGLASTQMNRAAVGEYHYRRALELSSTRIPMVLANLALNLKQQGRMAESRALYRESDDLTPNIRQTLLGWAQMEEADRQFDAANGLLDRIEKQMPSDAGTTLARAAILGRQKRYDEAVTLLDKSASGKRGGLRPMEMLERGRLLDKMGRYDDAWADFMQGKARAKEMGGQSYQEEPVRAFAEDMKKFFVRERVALLPKADVRKDVAQPIFILGFPRSGTTLLEQSLTASPAISAGDELTLIHDIIGIMPRFLGSPWEYPGALTELWMGDQREGLNTLRDYYLAKVRQMGIVKDGAVWFTDKMPLNEMHLGLISLLFPASPLIHMIRHPLDIMVSSMSNFFTHGAFCSLTLETAAKHLALSTEMVAHYRENMALNYLPVRYEDIVDDQEATMRRVFEFIGVPFDPAVLTFEANSRYARTASYAQVTEKLYDRSRFRYRNYRQHLEPAVPILMPLIERLGYTVEA